MMSTGTTENDNIEQRIGTQAISTMDGNAGGFTGSIQTGYNSILAVLYISGYQEDIIS
jgi:hypothetical protein